MLLLLVALCTIIGSFAAAEPWHSRGEPSQHTRQSRENFLAIRNKMLVQQWIDQAEAAIQRISHTQQPRPQPPTNPGDIAAVVALYNATNGPKWGNNSGWMRGDPCQDLWHGLYCSDGRIVEINLPNNLLSGRIPLNITLANQLKVLRLYSNSIGGTLPPGLFKMGSLQVLNVYNNNIGGTLPDNISCLNLTQLILSQNQLGGTLPTVWSTVGLQILVISFNNFQGPLPPAIGKLTELVQLILAYNQLTGTFPGEYGNLHKLQQLWLFQNAFTNATFPKSWEGLTNLTDFEADSLTFELPGWIGKDWLNLQTLFLFNGNLSGEFWPSLCLLKKIQYLRLFNNSLTGALPLCLCNMTTLIDLEISQNSFTGQIPDCIGNLQNLNFMYLSHNNISGKLPISIGQMVNLKIMDLSSNGLTGNIPSSFAGLVKEMVRFSLCFNKLSTVDDGLDEFFEHIKNYSCSLYSNPWSCPVSPVVPVMCGAFCSHCNTDLKHTNCALCVSDPYCGYCSEGPNCLDGSYMGPIILYWCKSQDWIFYNSSRCPATVEQEHYNIDAD